MIDGEINIGHIKFISFLDLRSLHGVNIEATIEHRQGSIRVATSVEQKNVFYHFMLRRHIQREILHKSFQVKYKTMKSKQLKRTFKGEKIKKYIRLGCSKPLTVILSLTYQKGLRSV